ncbi:serine hydrolase domain-containing protein [Flavobacterium sp.]|uniref:serine hydrolase domain-containing protein n=1 Tax=Flavobacterium sp. TaxID=239 RepID=UPI003F698B41
MKKSFYLFLFLTTLSFSQEKFMRMDSLLSYLNENDKFIGSISIREGEKVVFSKAYGFIDENQNIKATTNTKYKIGSITKIFTATIIMQLIEEKKLRLESKLTKFFPKVANADKISISDLLHHRTGIIDYINQDSITESDLKAPDTKEMLYKKIADYESLFEPNSKFLYSNSNYYLLGGIIEKLTHESFEENVRKRIVEKIGLKDTYYPNEKINTLQNESFSFLNNGTDWQIIDEWPRNTAYAAGELMATPNDLTQFIHALFNGKLVNKTSLEEMKKLKDGYGKGLMQFPFGDRKFFGHTGGIEGFRSNIGYYPNEDLSISLVVSGDNYNTNSIMIGILSIYYKMPFPFPVFVKLNEESIKNYIGTYSSTEIPLKIEIMFKEGTLMGQATGQPSFPLTPKSETEFVFLQAGVEIVFGQNTFILKQGGQKINFTKE